MSKKIRPSVFLEAAKILMVDMDSQYAQGIPCCEALSAVMDISSDEDEDPLYATPEFKLFKAMYCNGRAKGRYWFGRPYKYVDGRNDIVNANNQMKRVLALMTAYEVAKTLK